MANPLPSFDLINSLIQSLSSKGKKKAAPALLTPPVMPPMQAQEPLVIGPPPQMPPTGQMGGWSVENSPFKLASPAPGMDPAQLANLAGGDYLGALGPRAMSDAPPGGLTFAETPPLDYQLDAPTGPQEGATGPLGVQPGTLTLPTRSYQMPTAPNYQAYPDAPVRNLSGDAGSAQKAGLNAALFSLGFGGLNSALKGYTAGGKGSLAGSDARFQSEGKAYQDATQNILRDNTLEQNRYTNDVAGLKLRQGEDAINDKNTVSAYNANSQDAARREATRLKQEAQRFDVEFKKDKSLQDRQRLAAEIRKWAADAEKQGFDMADKQFDNDLRAWESKGRAATSAYNAISNRIAAMGGLSLRQQGVNLQGRGLDLREAEIDARAAEADAKRAATDLKQGEADQLKAQGDLLKLRGQFPEVDAKIAKLQQSLQQGKAVQAADGKWSWIPFTPEEAAGLQNQITGLQAYKGQLGAYGQNLKLRAGEQPPPAPTRTAAPPRQAPNNGSPLNFTNDSDTFGGLSLVPAKGGSGKLAPLTIAPRPGVNQNRAPDGKYKAGFKTAPKPTRGATRINPNMSEAEWKRALLKAMGGK